MFQVPSLGETSTLMVKSSQQKGQNVHQRLVATLVHITRKWVVKGYVIPPKCPDRLSSVQSSGCMGCI